MSERALRLLVGLLVGAAVARYLGPTEFGIWSIALGTVLIFSAGASMGADHIDMSEIARRQPEDAHVFIGSAIAVRLAWSALCVAAYLVVALVFADGRGLLGVLLAPVIPMASLSIFASRLQADGQFQRYALIGMALLLASAGMRLTGVMAGAAVEYFAIVTVVDAFLQVAAYGGCFLMTTRANRRSLPRPSRVLMTHYFRKCLPTALSALLVALYLRLELFMVSYLLGPDATGQWAAAMMFVTPWGIVAASLLPVVNRSLSQAAMAGPSYERRVIHLIRLMTLLACGAIFINWVAAAVLVPRLFGPTFDSVETIVRIGSLALIPLFLGSTQELWIAQQGHTSLVLKKVLLGLPLSALMLFLLGSRYGLAGIAAAMVASYCATAILLNAALDRRFFRLQLISGGLRRGR